jgi:hypothetical protein
LAVLWVLGVALLATLAARVFGRSSRGLAAFRAAYGQDGLLPVSTDERTAMQSFGRCIACGLCDRGEGQRIASSAGGYPGVMPLILASSRSIPDYRYAVAGFRHVPDEVLEAKERVCPTRVPMRRIAGFVRKKASEYSQVTSDRPDRTVGR